MMTRDINKKIEKIGSELKEENRIELFVNRQWKDDVPKKPGVYVLWSKRKKNNPPVYVGESSNLSERFSDIGSWRNHSFSSKIKNKYSLSSPKEVRDKISMLYNITFVELSYGRKEVEEYLIHNWSTHEAFNKESPRYLRSRGMVN